MSKNKKFVLGLTHVDLGWKKGKDEMAEIFDVYLTRLFDIIEQNPDFHYILEQAYHYHELQKRRPDLFEKLRKYIKSGNLEFSTGVASTIENNTTNGESLVRNMQIGLKFLKDNLSLNVQACMMIDTFGFPPQTPQVLNQFGFKSLFANRFGGGKLHDVFLCYGLDGSELVVAGSDIQSYYAKKDKSIDFGFYAERWKIDALFDRADSSSVSLVIPYSENEVPPDTYFLHKMKTSECEYSFVNFCDYMNSLIDAKEGLPIESADLNPEFSGAFSLRHMLKYLNRQTEHMLLEAEKISALYKNSDCLNELEDCWWEMAYTQFHDIITGSHPTSVYLDCVSRFNEVYAESENIISSSLKAYKSSDLQKGKLVFSVFNGLPYKRKEWISKPLPEGFGFVESVKIKDVNLPFFIKENSLNFLLELDATSFETISVCLTDSDATEKSEEKTFINKLENEFLSIEFGNDYMIKQILHKPSNSIIVENCNNLLVIQRDEGSFQVERPTNTEISCGCGDFSYGITREHDFGKAVITGTMPGMNDSTVSYTVTITLQDSKPYADITARINWSSEAARLRLCIPSTLGASNAYYEIPFGVCERSPYEQTDTCRGEWAAHRFVAVESPVRNIGFALANIGTCGVEVNQGVLKTTLLRAPLNSCAGMIPDDTSSDHGIHDFKFRLLPYAGNWQNSGIIQYAQEFNAPCTIIDNAALKSEPIIKYDNQNIVLSAVKSAEDGFVAVRLYESAGTDTAASIFIRGLKSAYTSDLREIPLTELKTDNEFINLEFAPFEIKTILIKQQ